jgi:hypothetical protein
MRKSLRRHRCKLTDEFDNLKLPRFLTYMIR